MVRGMHCRARSPDFHLAQVACLCASVFSFNKMEMMAYLSHRATEGIKLGSTQAHGIILDTELVNKGY